MTTTAPITEHVLTSEGGHRLRYATRNADLPIAVVLVHGWPDSWHSFQRAEQDALLAAIPGASLVVYNGAGHSPNWEQPERVAGDIEAFLRRCQRSPIAASRATRSASTASVSGKVSSAAVS